MEIQKIASPVARLVCGSYTVFGSGGYHVRATSSYGVYRRPKTEEFEPDNGFCGNITAEFEIPPGGYIHVTIGDNIGSDGRTLWTAIYYRPLVVDCGGFEVEITPPEIRKFEPYWRINDDWRDYEVIGLMMARERFALHPLVVAAIKHGGAFQPKIYGDGTCILITFPIEKELHILKDARYYNRKVEVRRYLQWDSAQQKSHTVGTIVLR